MTVINIPSLTTLAAQTAYPAFLSSSAPFSEIESASLCGRRTTLTTGTLLQQRIRQMCAQLLSGQGRNPPSVPRVPPFSMEILHALDGVLLVEELAIEKIYEKACPTALIQKARMLFYFLHTDSKEKNQILNFFRQDKDKEVPSGYVTIFQKNIEALFSCLFLNLPFEETLDLWKAAFAFMSSKKKQSSLEEQLFEAYAKQALCQALEKKPSLLTAAHIDTLRKTYPINREKLNKEQNTFILRVLSMASSGEAIEKAKAAHSLRTEDLSYWQRYLILIALAQNNSEAIKAYPLLFLNLVDERLRCTILEKLAQNGSAEAILAFKTKYSLQTADLGYWQRYLILIALAQNNSATAISAFKEAYPLQNADINKNLQCRILEKLAQNGSAEAISAFKKAYPDLVTGLDQQQRYNVLIALAQNDSATAIASFKAEFPNLATGLNEWFRYRILEKLARNGSVEAIAAFKKVYPDLATGLDEELQSWVLIRLAQNNSAAAIAAFKAVYSLHAGIDKNLRCPVLEKLAQNDSAEAISAFKKAYSIL